MSRYPWTRSAHASTNDDDAAGTVRDDLIPEDNADTYADEAADLPAVPTPEELDQAHADRLESIDTALDSLHERDRDRAAQKVRDRWQPELDSLHEHGRHSAYTGSMDAIESALSTAIQAPTDSALRVHAVTRQQQRDALSDLSSAGESLARTLDALRTNADELAATDAVAANVLTFEQYPQSDRDAVADAISRARTFTAADVSHGEQAATLRELAGRANNIRYSLRTD